MGGRPQLLRVQVVFQPFLPDQKGRERPNMADIISYDDWMRRTHGGRLSIRSSNLKAIDAALMRYHQSPGEPTRSALEGSLYSWIQTKGPKWKLSIRNRAGAIQQLLERVSGLTELRPSLDPETLFMVSQGLELVEGEPAAITAKLFSGARLEWRGSVKVLNKKDHAEESVAIMRTRVGRMRPNLKNAAIESAGVAYSLASNTAALTGGQDMHVGGGGRGSSAQSAAWLVSQIAPANIRAEVTRHLTEIMPDFMTQLAKSLTPFAGVIFTGGCALVAGCSAMRDEYRIGLAKDRSTRIMTAREPAEAMLALIRILERERNANVYEASVGLAEFGGKLAGVLLDGGTATNAAIGLSAAVVRLTNLIRLVVRDVQERNAANKIMKMGVDISVFRECPLIGCYLLCCAPTSVLINLMAVNWGEPGWNLDIEQTVLKDLQPAQEQARRIIHANRFVIPTLMHYPNVISRDRVKKNLKAMRKQMKDSEMVGFGASDAPAESHGWQYPGE